MRGDGSSARSPLPDEAAGLDRRTTAVSVYAMGKEFDPALTERLLSKLLKDTRLRIAWHVVPATAKSGLIGWAVAQLVVWAVRVMRCLGEHVYSVDVEPQQWDLGWLGIFDLSGFAFTIPKFDFFTHPDDFGLSATAVVAGLLVALIGGTLVYLRQRTALLEHRLQGQIVLALLAILDRLEQLENGPVGGGHRRR